MRINKKATFLPLSKTCGSTQQRLDKSIDRTLKFYQYLKYETKDGKIGTAGFKSALWQAAEAKPTISTLGDYDLKDVRIGHSVNSRGSSGYSMRFPQDFLTDKKFVLATKAQSFLKEALKFFIEISNPKIHTRAIKIMDNNSLMHAMNAFYKSNLSGTEQLSEQKLEHLLSNLNVVDKINALQALRYRLIADKHVQEAEPILDNAVSKALKLKFLGKKYDMSKFAYDEKISIISKKLNETITSARKALHEKYPIKQK